MKVTNSLFLFANLFVSVSDMLVKYFLITVKLRLLGFFRYKISCLRLFAWILGRKYKLLSQNGCHFISSFLLRNNVFEIMLGHC